MPSDIYDYLDKIDKDEETDDQVSGVTAFNQLHFTWLMQIVMSFEIQQDRLETLQRRY